MADLARFKELSETAYRILCDLFTRQGKRLPALHEAIPGVTYCEAEDPCNGRPLYDAIRYFDEISNCIAEHEPNIIASIERNLDTSVMHGPRQTSQATAHAAAVAVLSSVEHEYRTLLENAIEMKIDPHWDELTERQKEAVATIESNCQSFHYFELACKVRTERILYLKAMGFSSDTAGNSDEGRNQKKNLKDLPFGLQLCDVPQTLKRPGFNPVSVKNEDSWKLMEVLMAAYPNAVPESKLLHLFQHGIDQRKNARKALVSCIDSLGLEVAKWVLREMKT